MASFTTMARPYAKAAFEYAQSKQAAKKWLSVLSQLAVLVSREEVRPLLDHPKLTAEQVTDVILAIADNNKLDVAQKNFVRIIGEKRRLFLLPDIAVLFKAYSDQKETKISVQLLTTIEVDKPFEQIIINALEKRTGKKIDLTTTIDHDLIGGACIRIGDFVIDGSVRGQLQQMMHKMTS